MQAVLVALGVFGRRCCMGTDHYAGDLSVERGGGLEVATPVLKPYVVPITVVIIIVFFAFQKHGTAGVGKVFGPITLVWFIVIGILGIVHIVKAPGVLRAANPYYAVEFIAQAPGPAFLVLGSAVLVVTGGEALYADMGHFGRTPMKIAWWGVVLPVCC